MFFRSLEKRNYISKCKPNLVKHNGETTKTEEEIIKEVGNCYKDLYSSRNVTDINSHEHLHIDGIPKLSINQTNLMEGNSRCSLVL
jgi:hypothetical protein